jgi:oligopeptide/dipeptide ABC transporter ATP-binding protein
VNELTVDKILEIKNLKKYYQNNDGFFRSSKNAVKAVDDISFDVFRGETMGLVGESGCGKSTLGRTILGLTKLTAGSIDFNGRSIQNLPRKDRKDLRKKMQLIFQDPSASLNPRRKVREILKEPFKIHRIMEGGEIDKRITYLLEVVGLSTYHLDFYPYELSGGQKQRVGIARALAMEPDLIVCDEPVSALDVSIQAQVLNLLEDLQKEFRLTYLFIAHDLSVVYHISQRIGVMYLGKIVEIADHRELYENTLHPYTEALISAIPYADVEEKRQKILLKGDIPSPSDIPPGCRFHTRCPKAMEVCRLEEPLFQEYRQGHFVACHLYQRRVVTEEGAS